MNSLGSDDRTTLGLETRSIYDLIDTLKMKNCRTLGVKWQAQALTDAEIDENIKHINAYDRSTARDGYLCSTCDPFLALLTYLLNKVILVNYCSNQIVFEPIRDSLHRLTFVCNSGHFWFQSKI